jgi:hypothetical protein
MTQKRLNGFFMKKNSNHHYNLPPPSSGVRNVSQEKKIGAALIFVTIF